METEISMLKDIYFLLAVISAALSLIVLLCFSVLIVFLRKAFMKIAKEKQSKRLTLLFEKNKTEETIQICEEILAGKPNNVLALWYLAKSYFVRQEFMRSRDYLLRLRNVDPDFHKKYTKAYWSRINNLRREPQKSQSAEQVSMPAK